MGRHDGRSVRGMLFGLAGAAALAAGAGISVYAAEPGTAMPATAEASCGSVDPGFTYELEDTLRERGGSIDPGFSPWAEDEDASTIGGSIDPGFWRPIETCPLARLQDLLASPAAQPLGPDSTATPANKTPPSDDSEGGD